MERQSSEPAPAPSLLASVGRARRMAMAMSALRGSASGAQGDGPSDLCICQRPHSVVLCHVCGWYSRCRLLKSCRQHPNTRFLLDMTTCPRCRAPSHMMGEYDLGDRELPPCPLPMPSPQAVKGPSPSSRRSSSPETPDRRPSPLTSPGCGAAMGSGGQRVRMRPPLQSDSQGMQRKMRDRYCLQMQPRSSPPGKMSDSAIKARALAAATLDGLPATSCAEATTEALAMAREAERANARRRASNKQRQRQCQ